MAEFELEAEQGSPVGRIYAKSANYPRDRTLSMRPFLIERLFSTFLLRGFSGKYASFCHSQHHYHKKFGERLGRTLFELSTLKNQALKSKDHDKFKRWNELRMFLLGASEVESLVYNLDDPSPLFLSRNYVELLEPRRELSVEDKRVNE